MEHTDGFVLESDQGKGQDVTCEVAGLAIDLGTEAPVGVGVGDVDDLAGGENLAGDALRSAEPNLLHASRDPAVEFVRLLVVKKDRGAFAPQHLPRGLLDLAQQRPKFGRGRQPTRDGQYRLQIGDLFLMIRRLGHGRVLSTQNQCTINRNQHT